MKRLWISIGILLLLSTLSLLNAFYLNRTTRTLSHQLQLAQTAAEQDAWHQAAQITQEAALAFEENTAYFHITLKHQDVNEISSAFQEVTQYLACGEQLDEYAACNARLIALLDMLAQSEQPTLNNFL